MSGAPTKDFTGIIKDKKFRDLTKVGKTGETINYRMCLLKIDDKDYSTFDDEIMDAFSINDKVFVEYTEVAKADKIYYNIKTIMMAEAGAKYKEEKEQVSKEINSYTNTYITSTKIDIFLKEIMKKIDGIVDYSSIHEVKNIQVETNIDGNKVTFIIGRK
jgi:hypothetical protein